MLKSKKVHATVRTTCVAYQQNIASFEVFGRWIIVGFAAAFRNSENNETRKLLIPTQNFTNMEKHTGKKSNFAHMDAKQD